MPINKLLALLKPCVVAFLLVALLHFTGLLSTVSYYSQRALLVSGLLNAQPELKESEPFLSIFNCKHWMENKLT